MLQLFVTTLINWLRTKRTSSDFEQAKQFTESAAEGFWALYHLALTFHGRYMLMKVLASAEEGLIEVDPKVLGMYRLVLSIAPYQTYATIN